MGADIYRHTPGPWEWSDDFNSKLLGADGSEIIECVSFDEDAYIQASIPDGTLIAQAPDILKERDELREKVRKLEADALHTSHLLSEGANRIDSLKAENASLKELVREMDSAINDACDVLDDEDMATNGEFVPLFQNRLISLMKKAKNALSDKPTIELREVKVEIEAVSK
jgi:predicted RNase H-like nuclease (RuvC/YqgF family)